MADGMNSVSLRLVCRCEVGTTHWSQCNDTPIKFARFPVTGLVEGRSYTFRVRAVNKSGMSRPSRTSEVVAAMDPADRARMRGMVGTPIWHLPLPVCLLRYCLMVLLNSYIVSM